MSNGPFNNGLASLAAGLLASSAASFLERFPILGTASDFAGGFLYGLAVVAFAAALYLLLRSRRPRHG